MHGNNEIDEVLSALDEATREVARVKETMRNRRLGNPDKDDTELTTALDYWEGCKRDAEARLQRLST